MLGNETFFVRQSLRFVEPMCDGKPFVVLPRHHVIVVFFLSVSPTDTLFDEVLSFSSRVLQSPFFRLYFRLYFRLCLRFLSGSSLRRVR